MSPIFYCLYVNELVEMLADMGIGCHLRAISLSILLYANDMALVAPSLKGLQKLLIVTDQYCSAWDIQLNAKKSKTRCFGKKHKLSPLHLNGNTIEWVSR